MLGQRLCLRGGCWANIRFKSGCWANIHAPAEATHMKRDKGRQAGDPAEATRRETKGQAKTSQDRLTHVQLLFTWSPSPLQPSKFSLEYLLLPPKSAPENVSLAPEAAPQPLRPPAQEPGGGHPQEGRQRETTGDPDAGRQREASKSPGTRPRHPHEGRQRETSTTHVKRDKGRGAETSSRGPGRGYPHEGRQRETCGRLATRGPGRRIRLGRNSQTETGTPTVNCWETLAS